MGSIVERTRVDAARSAHSFAKTANEWGTRNQLGMDIHSGG
jgi:hypothetical protein